MPTEQEAHLIEQIRKRDEKLERKSLITALSWWWVGALVAYFVLARFWPIPDANGLPTDWALDIRKTIGSAFITFVAFTAFYDLVFRRKYAGILARSVARAVAADSDLLGKLSLETRSLHLKNSLVSLLGREIGDAMFADAVEPMIVADAGFRRHYRYCVTMLEQDSRPSLENLPAIAEIESSGKYYWIREEMEYQLFLPSKSAVFWGPFIIALAFDRDTLYGLYNDNSIYFRTLIELEDEMRAKLFGLQDTQILNFVVNVMGFNASEFSGAKPSVPFQISIERSVGKGVIRIITNELSDRSSLNRLIVSLTYPHRRDATHYTFSMPQPCQSFDMHFLSSGDVEGLEMTEYLSNIPRERVHVTWHRTDRNVRGISVRVDGWVFPLSGITFTWRNR